MISNISNTSNYKPNFTSEVRMPYSTAVELTQYKKAIQNAIMRQIRKLEANGEDNLVNITTRSTGVYPYRGVDKLGVQVLKRNSEKEILASPIYEFDMTYDVLTKDKQVKQKVVDIVKLYNSAKQQLQPLAKDNKFSRFI